MPVMTKPGTVLLTCEPFVYVANLRSSDAICDSCLYHSRVRRLGGDGRTLRRCAGCRTVFYCSKPCQKKGWKDGHKLECHGMKEMKSEMTAEEDPRLLLRALLKLQDGKDHFDLVNTEKGEVKRRFKDLISHSEEIKKDNINMTRMMWMIFILQSYLSFSPIKITLPGEAELIEIYGRIRINGYVIDIDCFKLGTGLYLAGSIFNHSCDEMASNGFEGTTMVVRSIKEIPKGLPIDKVTVSYIQTVMPSSERRNKLRETYYFHCECDKCAKGLFDKEMRSAICSKKGCKNEIDTEELRNPCGSCGNRMTDKEVENILSVEKEAIKELTEEGPNPMSTLSLLKQSNFSEGHWLMIKFNYNVYVKVTSEKDWAQAYYYGCKYLEGVRRYADPNNEEFGRTSARLSDLALFLDKMKESEEHLKAAKKALKISSGVNSDCYKRLIPPLELKIEQAKFIKLHNLPFRLGAVD